MAAAYTGRPSRTAVARRIRRDNVAIPAIAKSVYVCDEVLQDPISGKVSILNIWDRVRVPPDCGFPYSLSKIRVFVWWRGGVGRLKTKVEIVHAATRQPIATTATVSDSILDFTRTRGTVYGVYRFDDLAFPEPGYYDVEVYCEDVFVDDLSILLYHPEG
jgi:hypothetical protein